MIMNNSNRNQGTWAEYPKPAGQTPQTTQSAWIADAAQPARAGTTQQATGPQPARANTTQQATGPQPDQAAWSTQANTAQAVWPAAVQQPAPYTVIQNNMPKKEDTPETKKLKENFGFFGPATLLYAIFYAFCMFHNGSGVTFPFFVAGSLLLFCLFLSKLEITLKSGSVFYMAGMLLLGVSTFLTDDGRIIAFNKLGIFLLMMSLLLKQYFDTGKWRLGKYFGSMIQLLILCIGEMGRPFTDMAFYRKHRTDKSSRQFWNVMAGIAIFVPVAAVVLWLLSGADAVFREIINQVFGNITFENIMNVLLRVVFLFFFSYMLTAYLCKKEINEEVKDRRSGEPVLAITLTALLSLLYLFFSVIQVAGLFMGKLKLPAGYTYAMYAREGFFQLLAVSFLNLIIVLICISFFRESNVLKAILAVMSFCTFIMIASSTMRMIIYIRFYYLTFLRILVLWALALLAVLFLGVLVSIFCESFPLFRYGVAVVTVLYLALSFARPDYLIAKVNVANTDAEHMAWWVEEGVEPYHDFRYLANLSADAAPVLIPYMREIGYDFDAFVSEDAVEYALDNMDFDRGLIRSREGFGYRWMENLKNRTENFGLRTFNVSRYGALQRMRAE